MRASTTARDHGLGIHTLGRSPLRQHHSKKDSKFTFRPGDRIEAFDGTEHSRYVVIGLKTGKFQPEYAGKLNFYVAHVDDMLRRDHHNETIGILICGTKNDRSVRYSLGRSTSPMAVAAHTYDK
jgi:YhcG PDDEXK nuclease domain